MIWHNYIYTSHLNPFPIWSPPTSPITRSSCRPHWAWLPGRLRSDRHCCSNHVPLILTKQTPRLKNYGQFWIEIWSWPIWFVVDPPSKNNSKMKVRPMSNFCNCDGHIWGFRPLMETGQNQGAFMLGPSL